MIDPDNLRRQYVSMSFEELQNVRVNAVLAEEAQKILDKVLKTKEAARFVGKNLEERAKQLFEASPLVLELREYAQEEEQRIEDLIFVQQNSRQIPIANTPHRSTSGEKMARKL